MRIETLLNCDNGINFLTVQIDDSGTGDIVGPAFIGLTRVETGTIIIKEIPLELFNEINWLYKKPHSYAIQLVIEELNELNYRINEEKIILCRASIFDMLRTFFMQKGIKSEDGVIEGSLQTALEKKVLSYLKQIGVDQSKLDIIDPATDQNKDVYYHDRNKILREWVLDDYKNRLKYVKTGFKKAFARIKAEAEQKKR